MKLLIAIALVVVSLLVIWNEIRRAPLIDDED